jgi:hypothetical protein
MSSASGETSCAATLDGVVHGPHLSQLATIYRSDDLVITSSGRFRLVPRVRKTFSGYSPCALAYDARAPAVLFFNFERDFVMRHSVCLQVEISAGHNRGDDRSDKARRTGQR